MKKFLILGVAIFTLDAYAATKCVALNADFNCAPGDFGEYNPEWSATCTKDNTSITIKGISACASEYGFGIDPLETVSIGPDAKGYVGCWCKMTSPIESVWMVPLGICGATLEVDFCNQYCGMFCSSFTEEDEGLKYFLNPSSYHCAIPA